MTNAQDAAKHCEDLLKYALEKELSDEDCRQFQAILQTRTSMALPRREKELVQAIFRVEVMDDLNRMYLTQDRNEEAQKIMLAARDLRKEYHLPEGSLLAGATQKASGQRIVEAEIRAREETDATKPVYWMERAAYYQGREEWQEQENALRKALSLYDTPELREKGPTPGYRNVLGSLQTFLINANRLEDACELFFQQHEIVKDESSCLWELYYDYSGLSAKVERQNEYNRILEEDISKAVNQYIATVESGESKDTEEFLGGLRIGLGRLDLIRYSPELAISMNIFDFENNPHAWDILRVQNTLTSDKILRLLLFTPDEKSKSPEHDQLLGLFLTALEQEKLPVEYYYAIGEEIRRNATLQRNPANYPATMMFFERALQHIDRFPNNHPKYSICTQLAWCSLELGDWRNGEKYTVESFEGRGLQERELQSWLGRAANVAEKSGEKGEAERIRRRIANLGQIN
jgi:tetratricopeptide (TPR) repeat protein